MTNPINYSNQPIPTNYSGVTIQITNPTVNAAPQGGCYQTPPMDGYVMPAPNYYNPMPNTIVNAPQIGAPIQENMPVARNEQPIIQNEEPVFSKEVQQNEATNSINRTDITREASYVQNPNDNSGNNPAMVNSYPPQYYLNNYNYVQDAGAKNNAIPSNAPQEASNTNAPVIDEASTKSNETDDLKTSQEIIGELDTRNAEQKELEKKGKKTRVVALTNEYIMSLENYLNNPNDELRLMASKEILTRLDEDKSRYDDAALNALLNKMLQDPNKLVRIAALSAFSSQLASGNDYTETLLKQIQQNPNADKEDVLEASEILLKRSANTEIRYTYNTEATQKAKENNK